MTTTGFMMKMMNNTDNKLNIAKAKTYIAHRNQKVIELCMLAVCKVTKSPANIFEMKGRQRNIVLAKHLVSYLVKSIDNSVPLSAVAKKLKAHHTTILHGIKCIDNLRKTDPAVSEKVEEALNLILIDIKAFDKKRNQVGRFQVIDLHNCIALPFEGGKSVVLAGYTEEEANLMAVWASKEDKPVKPIKFSNTGQSLLTWEEHTDTNN